PLPPLFPLSLHDALPISVDPEPAAIVAPGLAVDRDVEVEVFAAVSVVLFIEPDIAKHVAADRKLAIAVRLAFGFVLRHRVAERLDRKSTRLNSSHVKISY